MKAHFGAPLLFYLLATPCAFAQDTGAGPAAPTAAEPPGLALVREGDKLMQEGRFDDAQAQYKKAVLLDGKNHLAYEGLGRVFFARGLFAPAVEQFRKAVEVSPSYDLGHYNIGYALRKAGKFKEAIDAYEEFRRRKPDDPDVLFGLAESYKALGDLRGAITNFEEYTKKEKRASEQTWVAVAKKEIERLGGEEAKAKAQVARAKEAEEATRRAEAAATKEREAATARERDAAAAKERDAATAKERDAATAKERDAAAAKEREAAEAARRRSDLEAAQGRDAESARQSELARERRRREISAARAREESTRRPREVGELPAAAPRGSRVTAMTTPAVEPQGPWPEATRIVPIPAGPSRLDRAGTALMKRGDRAYNQGRYSVALFHYKKASARAPRAAVPHYRVGLAELRLGNFAWAVEAFQRALTIEPNYEAARTNRDAARRELRR